MKKIVCLILLLIFLLSAGCSKKDSFENDLNALLPPENAEDFDLTMTLLEISRLFYPSADPALMNNELQ